MSSFLWGFLCGAFASTVSSLYNKCKKYNQFSNKLEPELSNALENDLYIESQKRRHKYMSNWYGSKKDE